MHFHALGEQVGGGLVVGLAHHLEHLPRRTGYRFLAGHQLPDHVLGLGHPIFLRNRGQLDKALQTLKPDMTEDKVREEVSKAQRQTTEVIEAAAREAQEAQMAKAATPSEEEEEEGDDSPETGQP